MVVRGELLPIESEPGKAKIVLQVYHEDDGLPGDTRGRTEGESGAQTLGSTGEALHADVRRFLLVAVFDEERVLFFQALHANAVAPLVDPVVFHRGTSVDHEGLIEVAEGVVEVA